MLPAGTDQPPTWTGVWPEFPGQDYPPSSVVYGLFDHWNRLCYVGSTGALRSRLKSHARDKCFLRWIAMATEDREVAYVWEDETIKALRPYLNRRIGR